MPACDEFDFVKGLRSGNGGAPTQTEGTILERDILALMKELTSAKKEKVNLSRLRVTDSDGARIADSIAGNQVGGSRFLTMTDMKVGDQTAQAIATMIEKRTDMTNAQVHGNNLYDASISRLLQSAMKHESLNKLSIVGPSDVGKQISEEIRNAAAELKIAKPGICLGQETPGVQFECELSSRLIWNATSRKQVHELQNNLFTKIMEAANKNVWQADAEKYEKSASVCGQEQTRLVGLYDISVKNYGARVGQDAVEAIQMNGSEPKQKLPQRVMTAIGEDVGVQTESLLTSATHADNLFRDILIETQSLVNGAKTMKDLATTINNNKYGQLDAIEVPNQIIHVTAPTGGLEGGTYKAAGLFDGSPYYGNETNGQYLFFMSNRKEWNLGEQIGSVTVSGFRKNSDGNAIATDEWMFLCGDGFVKNKMQAQKTMAPTKNS